MTKKNRWSDVIELEVDHADIAEYAREHLFPTSFREENGVIIAEGAVYEMWWDGGAFRYFAD